MVKSTHYIMKSNFIYPLGVLKSALCNPMVLNPDCTLDEPEAILENTDVQAPSSHLDQNIWGKGIGQIFQVPQIILIYSQGWEHKCNPLFTSFIMCKMAVMSCFSSISVIAKDQWNGTCESMGKYNVLCKYKVIVPC